MSTIVTRSPLSRRSLLFGAAGTAAGASLLASGCAPGEATGGANGGRTGSGAGPTLPTRIPYDEVKPDIPPANEYAVPGYLRYPDPALTSVPETPGDGSTITGFTRTSISAAPPMAQNGWWQNVNDQLGVTLDLQWVKGSEYVAKVQSMLAGDTLPEITLLPALPRLDQVLQAKFADLTDHLASDAVADYPMLANFPTPAWEESVYNSGIYGIPRPEVPIGLRMEARTDTFEELGVTPEFSDGKEFLDVCRAVTDRRAGRFAMVQPHATFLKRMFALPNVWEATDQGFRHEIESEQFVDYLEFVRSMWTEGLFHPKSFQGPAMVPFFQKPAFVLFEVGGAGFTRAMPIYRPGAPTLTVAPVVAPLAEGGGNAPAHIGPATSSILGLRKGLSPDRIRLILSVLNYTAAPFGTKEYLTVQYGKEGHNYDLVDGQPKASSEVTNELFPITRFPGAINFMYSPEFPEVVKSECAYGAAVGDNVMLNPAATLFSETEASKGQPLTRDITLKVADIIQGRDPVSSWPDFVASWAKKGGDAMRTEYEAQL